MKCIQVHSFIFALMLGLEVLSSLSSLSSAAEFYERNKKRNCLNRNPKMSKSVLPNALKLYFYS